MVIVHSYLKEFVAKQELQLGGDVLPVLNTEVEALIRKACKRARANDRKTLMAKDL